MAHKWTVMTDLDSPLITVTHLNGRIAIDVHSLDPMSTKEAERVRWAMGAAIGAAQDVGQSTPGIQDDRGSQGGEHGV